MRTTSRPKRRDNPGPIKSIRLKVIFPGAGPDLRERLRTQGFQAEVRDGVLDISISAKTPEEALESLKALGGLLSAKG